MVDDGADELGDPTEVVVDHHRRQPACGRHRTRLDGGRSLLGQQRIPGLPNGVALHPETGEIWFVTFRESGGGAQVAHLTPAGRFVLVTTSPRLKQLDALPLLVGMRTSPTSERQHLEAPRRWHLDASCGDRRKPRGHFLRPALEEIAHPAYSAWTLHHAEAVATVATSRRKLSASH
jgi:hypothetical protein